MLSWINVIPTNLLCQWKNSKINWQYNLKPWISFTKNQCFQLLTITYPLFIQYSYLEIIQILFFSLAKRTVLLTWMKKKKKKELTPCLEMIKPKTNERRQRGKLSQTWLSLWFLSHDLIPQGRFLLFLSHTDIQDIF